METSAKPESARAAAPVLRCTDLAVGYGRRQAVVTGVNFDVGRGEYWGIVGPNGCGKTALLKTIAGILPPIAGSVAWTSRERAVKRPRIGYVPQRDSIDPLYPMEVLEIVALSLGTERPWRVAASREDRDRARAALDRVGLAGMSSRGYVELSGGERQRVLLARALALEPDVLALDEPTSQLDPGSTERILDLLDRVHAERDLTVLLVSHDLSLVARRASHAFAVVHGKCASGPTASILTSETLTRLYEYPMTVVREGAGVAIIPGGEQ